jgi:formiminotetrahydrofolate cyclodeaminase
MDIIKAALEAIKLQARLGEIGSIMALSDVGVGVLCLKAALISGKLNVIINLNGIKDESFVSKVSEEMDALVEEGIKIVDETYAKVEERLKN